jgi:hypothetical protein
VVEADTVIAAIGQKLDAAAVLDGTPIELNRWGYLAADPDRPAEDLGRLGVRRRRRRRPALPRSLRPSAPASVPRPASTSS